MKTTTRLTPATRTVYTVYMDKDEALALLGLKDDNVPPMPGAASRVKATETDVSKLAEESTPKAFATIIEISQDVDINPKVRLAAAKEILDRGMGKAVQQTNVTFDHEETVKQLQQAFIGKAIDVEVVEEDEQDSQGDQ